MWSWCIHSCHLHLTFYYVQGTMLDPMNRVHRELKVHSKFKKIYFPPWNQFPGHGHKDTAVYFYILWQNNPNIFLHKICNWSPPIDIPPADYFLSFLAQRNIPKLLLTWTSCKLDSVTSSYVLPTYSGNGGYSLSTLVHTVLLSILYNNKRNIVFLTLSLIMQNRIPLAWKVKMNLHIVL